MDRFNLCLVPFISVVVMFPASGTEMSGYLQNSGTKFHSGRVGSPGVLQPVE